MPAAELLDDAVKTAAKIASHSQPIVGIAKACVNAAFESSLAEGLRRWRRLSLLAQAPAPSCSRSRLPRFRPPLADASASTARASSCWAPRFDVPPVTRAHSVPTLRLERSLFYSTFATEDQKIGVAVWS